MNMSARLSHAFRRRRQHGAVTVEIAVVFLVLATLLLPTFLIGRVLYQENILANVANVAAVYMAKGTLAEVQSGTRVTGATALVKSVLSDAGISADPQLATVCLPSYFCNGSTSAIGVGVQVQAFGDGALLPQTFYLSGSATVRYPQ